MSDEVEKTIEDVIGKDTSPQFDPREELFFELSKPIRERILACKTPSELIWLSTVMLHHAKDILICELGAETTKILFANLKFEDPVTDEEIAADEKENG
jgi:hypothetical protein